MPIGTLILVLMTIHIQLGLFANLLFPVLRISSLPHPRSLLFYFGIATHIFVPYCYPYMFVLFGLCRSHPFIRLVRVVYISSSCVACLLVVGAYGGRRAPLSLPPNPFLLIPSSSSLPPHPFLLIPSSSSLPPHIPSSSSLRPQVDGELGNGVTSKDVVLHICGTIGTAGGTGSTIEVRRKR